MASLGSVIARRGLVLLFSYIIILILVAAIMEGSGFSQKIYEAEVQESVRADIQALIRAGRPISQTELESLRKNLTFYYKQLYGLIDEQGNPIPPYVRMWRLVFNSLMFNFGVSTKESVAQLVNRLPPIPVMDVIAIVLPRTIVMVTVAEIIMIVIALLIAPKMAYHHGSFLDRLLISYFALFNAIPYWWLGMLFIFIFSYQLRLYPPSLRGVMSYINNFWQNPLGNFVSIVYLASLPIITIVIAGLGGWLYSFRAMTLRIVREDFVNVAKAKGLPEDYILRRYVLRVSLPPVITSVILSLATSLGGFIITESVFDWPGMGTLYYVAITTGDTNTVMGLFVLTVGVYIVARFLLEIIYVALDPRVRAR
jgi:peptide/nickel transport system permease protein